MRILFFLSILILANSSKLTAQDFIDLYPTKIPNSKKPIFKETAVIYNTGIIYRVIIPTLQVFLPEKDKATGTAILICPGGSYKVLVYDGEGVTIAKQLASRGITAFVLKYRLPDDELIIDKSIGPLQDAQQGIKMIRENCLKWGINPSKVGVMGFSAGGHLASTLATHYQQSLIENENKINLRPDFQVLVYPVISMQDGLTHKGSRNNLLGSNFSKDVLDIFSNEKQLNADSPPAYIAHAADDTLVDVENSIVYFQKLKQFKVPTELHIYPTGGHGFIFKHDNWMLPFHDWMKKSGW
jgi:acetyl esterase/lipase